MIGAIVGDIVGSRFEWYNHKSRGFTFLKSKELKGNERWRRIG